MGKLSPQPVAQGADPHARGPDRGGVELAALVRAAERGDKRRILELSVRNAEMGLEHERALDEARRNKVASTLDGLLEELALPGVGKTKELEGVLSNI